MKTIDRLRELFFDKIKESLETYNLGQVEEIKTLVKLSEDPDFVFFCESLDNAKSVSEIKGFPSFEEFLNTQYHRSPPGNKGVCGKCGVDGNGNRAIGIGTLRSVCNCYKNIKEPNYHE